MYLGSRPRRRSPHLTIILLLMILAAILLVYYIDSRRPSWAMPFEPTATATRPARSYVAEAEAYYGEGQLDEAIAAYQKAAALTPDVTSIHIRLAQLFILRERTAEAAAEARKAVVGSPSNPQAVATWCRALDWEGQYVEALNACECAIELDPKYAEAYAYLSEVYADVGNWGAARNYAQQAIDLNYQSVDAHRNQGYAYEMQGRSSKAVEAYENAIFLAPKLAPLYVSAGRNYRALGKYTQAVDRFERVIRLDPASPVGYDQLGWTYYTKGDYNRAVESLEQATTVDPEYAAAWGHLGIANYTMQQYEEAIVAFQRAIQLSEKDYLRRVRQVIILGQDTAYDPPRPLELMRGEFYPLDRRGVDTLTAILSPVLPEQRTVPQPDQTCGDLIALKLNDRPLTPATGPDNEPATTVTPGPYAGFLDAQGEAIFDLKTGQVEIRAMGIPRLSPDIPFQVQLLMWPGKLTELGSIQADQTGNAAIAFSFENIHSAPIDYYYTLGFSYVHIDQCDKGVPWLLIAVDIDPSTANPAWQGLSECPERQPTDESTITPTEQPGTG
jgi:tetratricopeptide (TPR) repeat protein